MWARDSLALLSQFLMPSELFLRTLAARLAPLLLLAWLAIAAVAPSSAQTPDAPPPPEARQSLDRARAQLDQIEAALKRPEIRDVLLQGLRGDVDPQLESLRRIVDDVAPRVETLKARVTQLGARPAAGQPPEAPDIARERTERERALKESDETLALARTLLLQAEQIVTDITDRRRSLFARQLFERSASPLNPVLWWNVAQSAPRAMRALGQTADDWWRVLIDISAWSRWLIALAGLAAAFFVLYPLTRLVERYAMRGETRTAPPRGEKAFRAGVILVLGAARPALAAYLAYSGFETAGLLPMRVAPVMAAALAGLAVVAAVRAVAQAFFAPDAPAWRVPALSDANAAILKTTVVRAAAVTATGKTIETINQAISADLPFTIATRAIFALLFAAVMWRALSAARPEDPSEEACLGPYVPPPVTLAAPARAALAAALVAIVAATLTGYVALGVFLVDQVLWLGFLAVALALLLISADELVTGLLAPDTRASRLLSESVGLRRRSVEQAAVIASGLIKLLICFIAVLLAIAPWGVESTDILSSARAALFGFRIGDVTISLSAIVGGMVVFAIGIFLTRSGQRWLDDKFLPRTDLDSGIKNSIRTAVGYVGIVLAAAIAISSLGLSLDRIAIIAGALSVGIGFGLQSVVNNFVSGLILLWERPIRVGDLVEVGGDTGVVRRINVRSTEIDTGERATVIIPNSNLVSGVVKNRVHADRTGRVLIALSVPRLSDPAAVARVMTDAAAGHPDVMKTPPPRVVFKKIDKETLEFDLVCFVGDVDVISQVSSDLHFAIFPALREAELNAPAQRVDVEGMERIEDTLEQIAEAIENDREDEEKPTRKAPETKPQPAKAKAPAK